MLLLRQVDVWRVPRLGPLWPCYWQHPGECLWKRASLVSQMAENLPTTQETCVRSLGQEDTLEKEMATHSSILARKIPWTEEPGGL